MPPLKCISPHKSAPCLKNFEPEDFFKMIEQNRYLKSSLKGDLIGLYRYVLAVLCLVLFKLQRCKTVDVSFPGDNIATI